MFLVNLWLNYCASLIQPLPTLLNVERMVYGRQYLVQHLPLIRLLVQQKSYNRRLLIPLIKLLNHETERSSTPNTPDTISEGQMYEGIHLIVGWLSENMFTEWTKAPNFVH